jgi:hypothetical protein
LGCARPRRRPAGGAQRLHEHDRRSSERENKQWLDGTAQANAAIDKLDEQLSQLGKPKGADVAAN